MRYHLLMMIVTIQLSQFNYHYLTILIFFIVPSMTDLPSYPINQLRAFTFLCVDYAGPFLIIRSRYRHTKPSKAYVCIFVCCCTKAIHIELVSNLNAETFLAAFQRFVAGRGACLSIHSDQGTNFIGASWILHEITKKSANMSHKKACQSTLCTSF